MTTSNFSSTAHTEGESGTTSGGNYSLFQAGSYANEQYSLPCVVQTNNGQHATTFEVDRVSSGTHGGSEVVTKSYADAQNSSNSTSTTTFTGTSGSNRHTEGQSGGSSNRYQAGSYLNQAWNLACVVLNEAGSGIETSLETASSFDSSSSSESTNRQLTISGSQVTVSINKSSSDSATVSSLLSETASSSDDLHQEGSYANDRWTIILAQAETNESHSSLLSSTTDTASNYAESTQVTWPTQAVSMSRNGSHTRGEESHASESSTSTRLREGGFSLGSWHLWMIEETGSGSAAATMSAVGSSSSGGAQTQINEEGTTNGTRNEASQAEENHSESSSHTSWRLGSYQNGQYSYSSISYSESSQEAREGARQGTSASQETKGSASTVTNGTFEEEWASGSVNSYSHVGSISPTSAGPGHTSQAITVGDEEAPDLATSLSSLTSGASGSSSFSSVATTTKNYSAGMKWSLATIVRTEQTNDDYASSSHGSKAGGQLTLDSYVLDSHATAAMTQTENGTGGGGHQFEGGGFGGGSNYTESWIASERTSNLLTHHEDGTFTDGAYNLASFSLDAYERDRKVKDYEKFLEGGGYYRKYDLTDKEVTTDKVGAGRVGVAEGSFVQTTVLTELHGETTFGIMFWTPSNGEPSVTTTTSSGNFALVGELLTTAAVAFVPSAANLQGGEVSFVAPDLGDEAAMQQIADFNAAENNFGDVLSAFLNQLDQGPERAWAAVKDAAAGALDRFTMGLSTRIIGWVAGAEALEELQSSAGWQVGAAAGGLALAVGFLPCGLGGLTVFRQIVSGVQLAGASMNAVDAALAGDWWSFGANLLTAGVAAVGLRACFTGDMEVLTRRGAIRWDQLQEGDEVLSRDEFDAAGPTSHKRVEEIFRTYAPILNVHFRNGQVHRTTSEHPYWVQAKGWLPAQDLRAGDRLLTLDGTEAVVEEVFFTGQVEPVFNARIADYHTYFVRSPRGTWVWAHNLCATKLAKNIEKATGVVRRSNQAAHHIVARTARLAKRARLVLKKAGIALDDAENGVLLGRKFHRKLHTTAYYKRINKILARAKTPAQVRAALDDIADQLQSGRRIPRMP